MKFLIFNVIVLCSLGYMLTSKPDENFNQWFSNTKDKISNLSKEEVVKTIKKATSSNKLTEDNQIKKTSDEIKKGNTNKNLNQDENDKNQVKVQENSKIAELDIKEEKEQKTKDNEIKKIINGVLTMHKIITISLLVLFMSFSGNVLAHCGDAEAHAAASHEHIENDKSNEGDEKKEKK